MAAKNFRAVLLVFMLSWVMVACTVGQPSTPAPSQTPASSDSSEALAEFPLAKGTTWAYAYVSYEPTTADPTQVMTATYLFTETVVDTQVTPPYFVAQVQREERLIQAPPDWPQTESSRPHEYWYIVKDRQVYESFQKPASIIPTDTLTLAYDFPLALGRSWCPLKYMEGEKVQDCTAKRTVVSQESYETPAGKFDNCYEITEDVNSGGVTQWFCKSIGVVAQKYDHGGTRFGFQQTLVSYSKGSP